MTTKRNRRDRRAVKGTLRRYVDDLAYEGFSEWLAAESGVSRPTIFRALRGRKVLYSTALRLLPYLDDQVTLQSLCGDRE